MWGSHQSNNSKIRMTAAIEHHGSIASYDSVQKLVYGSVKEAESEVKSVGSGVCGSLQTNFGLGNSPPHFLGRSQVWRRDFSTNSVGVYIDDLL